MVIVAVLIAFLAIGSVNFYVAKKVHKGLSYFFGKLKFWVVCSCFFVSTVIFVLGFLRNSLPFPTAVKDILAILSYCWMGIFLYLLLYTIISDIIILLCRLFKFSFSKKPITRAVAVLAVFVLTVITSGYGFYNARQIDRIEYDIKLESKTDISDIKMVMISDIHLGTVGCEGRLESIVKEINSQKPDVVCIAGDLFDSSMDLLSDPEKAIENLKKIESTYGVYACFGNHDAGDTFGQMSDFLEKANINILNDQYTVIDERLILAGRLDKSAIGGRDIKRKALSKIEGDNDLPVVVMDHNPANYSDYSSDVDLILSGHTHKGQIFPVNLVTDILYEVDYGYYRKDNNSPQIIVTSGIGYWGMPMRVGTNSELVVINFKN